MQWPGQRGNRLHHRAEHDRFAVGHAALDAAGPVGIAIITLCFAIKNLVMHLTARQLARAKSFAEFHALDRRNRNDRRRDLPVKPAVPLDMAAQPRHQAAGRDLKTAAQRVSGSLGPGNQGLLRCRLRRAANRNHPRGNRNPAGFQQLPTQSADRHPRRRLSRAGPLQDVAHISAVIFLTAAEIGMPRPRRCHRWSGGFAKRRHLRFPVHPVRIDDAQTDRTAECFTKPHPGQYLCTIAFDLHPAAAAKPFLPPGHFLVQLRLVQRQTGRQPFHDRRQAWPMRFSRSQEP